MMSFINDEGVLWCLNAKRKERYCRKGAETNSATIMSRCHTAIELVGDVIGEASSSPGS
jgi:hypothetical protein